VIAHPVIISDAGQSRQIAKRSERRCFMRSSFPWCTWS